MEQRRGGLGAVTRVRFARETMHDLLGAGCAEFEDCTGVESTGRVALRATIGRNAVQRAVDLGELRRGICAVGYTFEPVEYAFCAGSSGFEDRPATVIGTRRAAPSRRAKECPAGAYQPGLLIRAIFAAFETIEHVFASGRGHLEERTASRTVAGFITAGVCRAKLFAVECEQRASRSRAVFAAPKSVDDAFLPGHTDLKDRAA